MATLHLACCSLSLLLLLLLPISSLMTDGPPSVEIVRGVCNQTAYYTYCINALYSDPRTPNADHYFLAYISFGLVFANASNSLDHVSLLLKSPKDPNLTRGLQVCQGWYRRSVTAMLSAKSDLDSHSFSKLASYAGQAVRAADECEAAVGATSSLPALGLNIRNRDIKRLSYICTIVSRLLP
ncbi:hypothetical protein MLD38_027720 [Melastoma candidum]|uniref:Uncharacterized protein n=1 Tax=Melastoma candidum TaxID=119954 RepID=A0ACB9P3W3_9MYRT|nr:hypothetical protein MLD38_027720 [Melastoma candidum]